MNNNIKICRQDSKVLKIVKLLIEHGANVNELHGDFQDITLYNACIYENLDLVKLLLVNKTDINNKNKLGWTPLHMSLSTENRFEIIKFLVNNCANPEKKNR